MKEGKMNKKNITAIIISTTILFMACSPDRGPAAAAPQKLTVNENSTIVCFGDSVTYGYGAGGKARSFPMVMQQWVNIPVINSGVNNDTSAGGLERIQKDVLDHNPVIVIIYFGANDLYNSKPKLTINEIESNFRQMIELIDTGNTKIYIARFFNNQMRFLDIFFSFDRMLKRLENDYGIEIIDNVWENIWGKKELKYNLAHANSKGYEVMAQNIFNAIKPNLEYNNLIQ
jgi:lysophospholipase L1-like esterase